MITAKEYRKKTEKEWRDTKVRTLRRLQNGWVIIPKGTILKINSKYLGFGLEGVEECPHCNIGKRLSISRVGPEDLEVVEE